MGATSPSSGPLLQDAAQQKTRSNRPWYRRLGRAIRNDIVVAISWAVLAIIVICALFSPQIAPHDPTQQNLVASLQPPALTNAEYDTYQLGTDSLGRDVLSNLIYGSRISLLVGVLTVFVRGGMGILIGLVAGYFRGPIDDLMMRIADIQLTLPFLLVAVAVLAVTGPGLLTIIAVLGFTGWVYFGRVVRSETLSLREREFVLAARTAGATSWYIMRRHILPNTTAAILVISTLQVAQVIIAEASLSFLGLGVPAGTPTWGQMIARGRDYVGEAWWLPVFPGLAIFVTVLAINVLGDWLRDRWDPRLRRSL